MDYTALAKEFIEKTHQFRSHHQQKHVDEAMRGETFVILYLLKRRGSVQPNEISTAMNISSARVTATLNSLERKGMVTRRIDPEDRRRILVDITEAGRSLALQHQEMVLASVRDMLEKLGETDARELIRILGKLVIVLPKDDFQK